MNQTLHFKTDLSCESCVETLRPVLDAEKRIDQWSVDLKTKEKILTVSGSQVDATLVSSLLKKAGYENLGQVETKPVATPSLATYQPLIVVFLYLIGAVTLKQYSQSFEMHSAMNDFMGGFFIIFSFFKMMNLSGFADAYSTYDLLAKRSRVYAYIYPFIELALGVAYLTHFNLVGTNIATLIVMGVSIIGVIDALKHKRKIQCACLGSVFNLPMTSVTLGEDALMMAMALVGLFF